MRINSKRVLLHNHKVTCGKEVMHMYQTKTINRSYAANLTRHKTSGLWLAILCGTTLPFLVLDHEWESLVADALATSCR